MRFGFSRQVGAITQASSFLATAQNGDSNQFRKARNRNRKDHQSGFDRRNFVRASHRYCSQEPAPTGNRMKKLPFYNKKIFFLNWLLLLRAYFKFSAAISMQNITRWRRCVHFQLLESNERRVPARDHGHFDVFNRCQ